MMIAGAMGAAPVQAEEGDPRAGQRLAATCMGCHAVDGARNAYPSYRVPRIGGQHEQYLFDALVQYRDGERDHPTMRANTQNFTEEELRDIAAFFAQER